MTWEVINIGGQDLLTEVSPVHAGLLPTKEEGEIVFFGGYFGVAGTYIFDVAKQTLTLIPDSPTTNMFCCGHTFLADGRFLIAGGELPRDEAHAGPDVQGEHLGHPNQGPGDRICYIFRPRGPVDDRWKEVDSMNYQPPGWGASRGGGRWYPSVVLLGNGEVFAMGGHPDVTDFFLPDKTNQNYRHNNNTPERYSPGADEWTYLADGTIPEDLTAKNDVVTDGYHRLHLLPDGSIFFSTRVRKGEGPLGEPSFNRFYDAFSGKFIAPKVEPPPGNYPAGLLLPLLPDATGNCKARVMICGREQPMRIDPSGDSPQWVATSGRTGAAAGIIRSDTNCVILPTGDIFLSGGVTPSTNIAEIPNSPVLLSEIYRPGINWETNTYDPNLPDPLKEKWTTAEAASIGRGYHSVALLLPNGRVWTAGSTDFGAGTETVTVVPTVDERRIEIYIPDYDGMNRPSIKNSPISVGYNHKFDIFTDQADSIERVALIRCASVTHAFDVDQRYVGLNFDKMGGDRLTATSPLNSNIAPPGYYMLWIVDESGAPCALAKFIRVAPQKCFIITDRSTFSILEVESLVPPAPFSKAFYVVLDGFMKHELGSPPAEPIITFLDPDGNEVPGMHEDLNKSPLPEDDDPDIAQRYTFSYDIIFDSTDAFNGMTEDNPFKNVTLRVEYGAHVSTATLTLTIKSNPYMRDGDVPWLSIDLQVFTMRPDESFAKVTQGEGPGAGNTFITDVINQLNSKPNLKLPEDEHPFAELSGPANNGILEPATIDLEKRRVYNYAVARVRYRAAELEETTAKGVRVFFRVFPTADTALLHNGFTYPRTGEEAAAAPGIGYSGSEIATMPFFAEPRKADITQQFDSASNLRDIKGGGTQEVRAYFGCWLDFNQQDQPGEPAYRITDPLDGIEKPIQDVLLRSDHLCLVAELYYVDDPIPPNATPGSSDNLAQRNLTLSTSDNPGSAATHTVQTTFEVKPSHNPFGLSIMAVPRFGEELLDKGTTLPDELLINWNNLPRDSHVTLYFPDVDVDQILVYARSRLGPSMLSRVDDHTIGCKVSGITYIPLPGGRVTNIPGLMTIQLPPGVKKGQEFTVVVQQTSAFTGMDGPPAQIIVGAFQFTISVAHAEDILPGEIHRLSLLRHVALAMPATSRWYPVFARYLDQIADRVRGLGGNPDEVAPSAAGTGERDERWCCWAQWLLAGILAALLVLIGLLTGRRYALILVLSIIVLTALTFYWLVKCRPTRCQFIELLLLGFGVAGAVLGLIALLSPLSVNMSVLAVLAIITGLLIVAALIFQCWGKCWCSRKSGRRDPNKERHVTAIRE